MSFRFYIIDRQFVQHEIDEPTGWDKHQDELKRDLKWHGVFFGSQGTNDQEVVFEFYGKAKTLIQTEYEAWGARGEMQLVIEEDCGSGYQERLRGDFVFPMYEFNCEKACYVKIPVEIGKDLMTIQNNRGVKVDLDGLKAFDGTTDLTPYDKLGFDLELPGKSIFIQDRAETNEPSIESFDGNLMPPLNTGSNVAYWMIEFGLPDNQLSEIGSFLVNPTHLNTMATVGNNPPQQIGTFFTRFRGGNPSFPANNIWPLNLAPLLNYFEGSANWQQISNPVQFSYRIKGTLEVQQAFVTNNPVTVYLIRLPDRPTVPTNGELESHYEWISEVTAIPQMQYNPNHGAVAFDVSFSEDIVINENDRFYLFMALTERKSAAEISAVNAGAKAIKLTLDTDSFVRITNLSQVKPTITKAYMVNEAISRVVEIITNDNVRAYSEYFGRTDSQPYSHPEDGCGSLEAITDGLRIRRQETKQGGNTSLFTQSLTDLFNGLNPIHHIGMGLEEDPQRIGRQRLRVEPWNYFYKEDVIFSATNIGKLTKTVVENEVFKTIQVGYQKWEAEEYNGLDEFLTRREFRTSIDSINNTLTVLSQFVASGYAIEITRRKGKNDSKDWRYDKDTFIICCQRNEPLFGRIDFLGATQMVVFRTEKIIKAGDVLTITGSALNNGVYNVVDAVLVDVAGSPGTQVYSVTVLPGSLVAESTGCSMLINNPADIEVELGKIINPQNIIDPATIYNWRIRPAYNALRWMNKFMSSYVPTIDPTAKLYFTNGEGNYFASGALDTLSCDLSDGEISEKDDLGPENFDDPVQSFPFLTPERVLFDYPLTMGEYALIKANPYGLIYYQSECEEGLGWIEMIKHRSQERMATFTLIPQIKWQ